MDKGSIPLFSPRRFSLFLLIAAVMLLFFHLFAGAAVAEGTSVALFKVGQASYELNNQQHPMDVAPYIKNGRTYLPIRYVARVLGITDQNMVWTAADRKVTILKDQHLIQMQLGSKLLWLDGKATEMDAAPEISGDRLMLPVRYVVQALGGSVLWDESSRTTAVIHNNTSGSSLDSETQPSIKEASKKCRKQVVLIKLFDEKGRLTGNGSGVVVGDGSMIATNYHVIEKVSSAEVVDEQGNSILVSGVLSTDPDADLTVLKVNGKLEPAHLGDSDKVEVGDEVIAIGNPLWVLTSATELTVSSGIISGIREIDGKPYIQTTAPISPGSSGGGLFTLNGDLVAMVVGYFKNGQNLNLAIPVNRLKPLLDALPERVIPLDELNRSSNPATAEKVIQQSLQDMAGSFQERSGTVYFSYAPGSADPEYDLTLVGTIDSDSYSVWIKLTDEERDDIIGVIAGIIDEKSGGAIFNFVADYQDYWKSFPYPFDPEEIADAGDGKWLVTHPIGIAYSDEENYYWDSFL